MAETWDEFAEINLARQEWALVWWHTWKVASEVLDLTPAAPLPPPPVFQATDLAGAPRVWRVDFYQTSEVPGVATQEVTFGAAETHGLPPSLYALRRALPRWVVASGQVRVTGVSYDRGRFTVKLQLR